jgi:hypothetical protein
MVAANMEQTVRPASAKHFIDLIERAEYASRVDFIKARGHSLTPTDDFDLMRHRLPKL